MITRLLVANRGEIAVRILKTCRRLGIQTAAIYSKADADAPHLELANHTYDVGPEEAAASYLNMDAILKAARHFEADALHPGYGFLAESPLLAKACEKAGICFVGPNVDAIRKMGSKVEAKRIAEQVGIPIVPGYYASQDEKMLAKEASRIGFPLFIKASAGGGGKGMRLIKEKGTFSKALSEARQEAKTAFDDDSVLLEKQVVNARHIEVQIAGDSYGNCIHLFERECSIQRRHQKLIEEAPAAFLSDKIRTVIFENAVCIAKAIRYDSLGTVEFLYDEEAEEAYFLEMNTRLQVEHPTTEMITGLDLVELQLRIAEDEPLPFTQSEIAVSGWAIEARVNAEAPAKNFQPETGRILLYDEPKGSAVRIDSGVKQGSEVTSWYDPLLAKVIAHGKDREEARTRLAAALRDFMLAGVITNLEFLNDVLTHPNFSKHSLSTHFLEQTFPEGWQAPPASPTVTAAGAAYVRSLETSSDASLWQALGSWRLLGGAEHAGCTHLLLQGEGGTQELKIAGHGGNYRIAQEDGTTNVRLDRFSKDRFSLQVKGEAMEFFASFDAGRIAIASQGKNAAFALISHLAAEQAAAAPEKDRYFTLYAPMPGLITEIAITVGDRVQVGDVLITMEAMKLVHNLIAESDGVIQSIHCEKSNIVPHKAPLVEIGPQEKAKA